MTDLFTTAMTWIKHQGMPEPTGMKLIHTSHMHRIEINYAEPIMGLPDLGWTRSTHGPFDIAETTVEGIEVSVYAAVTA